MNWFYSSLITLILWVFWEVGGVVNLGLDLDGSALNGLTASRRELGWW